MTISQTKLTISLYWLFIYFNIFLTAHHEIFWFAWYWTKIILSKKSVYSYLFNLILQHFLLTITWNDFQIHMFLILFQNYIHPVIVYISYIRFSISPEQTKIRKFKDKLLLIFMKYDRNDKTLLNCHQLRCQDGFVKFKLQIILLSQYMNIQNYYLVYMRIRFIIFASIVKHQNKIGKHIF